MLKTRKKSLSMSNQSRNHHLKLTQKVIFKKDHAKVEITIFVFRLKLIESLT